MRNVFLSTQVHLTVTWGKMKQTATPIRRPVRDDSQFLRISLQPWTHVNHTARNISRKTLRWPRQLAMEHHEARSKMLQTRFRHHHHHHHHHHHNNNYYYNYNYYFQFVFNLSIVRRLLTLGIGGIARRYFLKVLFRLLVRDFSIGRIPFLSPASVAQVTETQCAPTGMVYRRSRGAIPRVGR